MAKSIEKRVKDSLLEQLQLQGKTGEFYIDLVNDYMAYWKLKKQLIADIKENGLRISIVNGNGITAEKPNESIPNLQKTTASMLKILNDLNLKVPINTKSNEDDYL